MPFTRGSRSKLAVTIVATLIAALAIPTIASAQRGEPTVDQYETTLSQIEGDTGSGSEAGPGTPGDPGDPDTGLSARVGPLPFTGFDVIAMIAVALAVAGLGLALQRIVSRPPSDGLS